MPFPLLCRGAIQDQWSGGKLARVRNDHRDVHICICLLLCLYSWLLRVLVESLPTWVAYHRVQRICPVGCTEQTHRTSCFCPHNSFSGKRFPTWSREEPLSLVCICVLLLDLKQKIYNSKERNRNSILTNMQVCIDNVTHMKFRAKPGNFIGLSYIGQSDLHITYYGLPHVWYTPGRQQV